MTKFRFIVQIRKRTFLKLALFLEIEKIFVKVTNLFVHTI